MIVLQKESWKKEACLVLQLWISLLIEKKEQNFEGRLPILKEYINWPGCDKWIPYMLRNLSFLHIGSVRALQQDLLTVLSACFCNYD